MWICAFVQPRLPDGHRLYAFFKKLTSQKKITLFLPSSEAEVLGHIWLVKSAMCPKCNDAFRHLSNLYTSWFHSSVNLCFIKESSIMYSGMVDWD
jgi:hypothetical protein